jgi:peptide/nickel transport system permease protein
MAAPSWQHLLGTDNFGRDIFSRVIQGAGATFVIAAATVAIGLVAGLVIGGLTGYYGGWVDEILMRLNDSITAFPSILLALVFIAIFGSGKYQIILSLGLLFVPSFARIVRTEVAKQKNLDYVQSARLMGAGDMRILFVHILPNTVPVLLSTVAIGFNNAVLAEASMSYLGVGVQPPDPSLGRMLNEAQSYLLSAPWYALSAGVAIILLVLGFGLLSEGLGGDDRA